MGRIRVAYSIDNTLSRSSPKIGFMRMCSRDEDRGHLRRSLIRKLEGDINEALAKRRSTPLYLVNRSFLELQYRSVKLEMLHGMLSKLPRGVRLNNLRLISPYDVNVATKRREIKAYLFELDSNRWIPLIFCRTSKDMYEHKFGKKTVAKIDVTLVVTLHERRAMSGETITSSRNEVVARCGDIECRLPMSSILLSKSFMRKVVRALRERRDLLKKNS